MSSYGETVYSDDGCGYGYANDASSSYDYTYGYVSGDGSPGYRYGNGVLQKDIREYGPGQYGPSGKAQYYGGQSALGYAYYVVNTDGTSTCFQGGLGGPGGYYIPYGGYPYSDYGSSYAGNGYGYQGSYTVSG